MAGDVEDLEGRRGVGAVSPEAVVEAMQAEARQAARMGDYLQAVSAYERLVALMPGRTDLRLALAECLRAADNPREAILHCAEIIRQEPGHPVARGEMAECLCRMGRKEEAMAICSLLVHEHPQAPETWSGLARLLAEEGRDRAAEVCLRRALTLSPGHVRTLAALGSHLARQGRHGEAAEILRDAVTLAPELLRIRVALSLSLAAIGRMAEALQQAGLALALDPEDGEARMARAALHMWAGRLEESWKDFQWRHRRPGRRDVDLPGVAWDGSVLGNGRLLIHDEGSVSEIIRMARFVPLAALRTGGVVLRAPRALLALFEHLDGVALLLPSDRPIPVDLPVDAHISLLDLPWRLGFPMHGMKQAPWLEAPSRRCRPILTPPGVVLKVGLAWSSRDAESEIPFAPLTGLAALPGVALFALEPGRGGKAATMDPSLVTDLGPSIAGLDDLAGRISELDVVVSSDQVTAHVAGAMGKPVLLLIPAHAHPRWQAEGEATPWYPSLRLIRRKASEGWGPALAEAARILAVLADDARQARAGVLERWRGAQGTVTAFVQAHLRPGDLLLDIQSGVGTVIPERDDVEVLATEPAPRLAALLAEAMKGRHNVTVVKAALGEDGARVLASVGRGRGQRVFPIPDGFPCHCLTVGLDSLLESRPGSAARRLVLRIGQVGWEDSILASLEGRPAAVVVMDRAAPEALERLAAEGYSFWSLPGPWSVGKAQVWEPGSEGAVLALAAGLSPMPSYGPAKLPPTPEDEAQARADAAALAAEATRLQAAQNMAEASALQARALMTDPFGTEANANRAVLMHMAGRREAAVSCYRRAELSGSAAGISANLATALRELHRFDEAETALARALAERPEHPDYLFDLALLRRDQGRLDEAIALLEDLRGRRPGVEWSLSQVLLGAGRLEDGLALMGNRPSAPPPLPDVPIWEGEDILVRAVLVHQDCDLADAVMLARFLPMLAAKGALLSLLCVTELVPLVSDLPGVEEVLLPGDSLPACDVQVGMSQLPRLLMDGDARVPIAPYLGRFLHGRRTARGGPLRVGLAWGGRPPETACPLSELLILAASPSLALMALPEGGVPAPLEEIGADALIEAPPAPPADLGDMAALIADLDVVVGGDVAALHLAAAMGKPAMALLPDRFNWRWPGGRDDSPWYQSARVFRQSPDGSWRPALDRVATALRVLADGKATRRP